jgi:hypothetical protein
MGKTNVKPFRCFLSLLLGLLAILGAYFCGEIGVWPAFGYFLVLANIFFISGLLESHYIQISKRIERIEDLVRSLRQKDELIPPENNVDGCRKKLLWSYMIPEGAYILFVLLFFLLICRIAIIAYRLHSHPMP